MVCEEAKKRAKSKPGTARASQHRRVEKEGKVQRKASEPQEGKEREAKTVDGGSRKKDKNSEEQASHRRIEREGEREGQQDVVCTSMQIPPGRKKEQNAPRLACDTLIPAEFMPARAPTRPENPAVA